MKKVIQQLAQQFDFSYKTKLIPQQNWNAIWESNFQPILIDDFCGIRADFHLPFDNIHTRNYYPTKNGFWYRSS